MTLTDKVLWSEGMFLQAMHFQQQERYFHYLIRERFELLAGNTWGITELEWDNQMLKIGKLSLLSCRGIFQDGTPFHVPVRDKAPPVLTFPADAASKMVYLALPCPSIGCAEVSYALDSPKTQRYFAETQEIYDSQLNSESSGPVAVARLELRLITEVEAQQGYICLGLVRIAERNSDHSLVLDETYLPPCLTIQAITKFSTMVREVHSLLQYRGKWLSQRLTDAGTGGIAEITDFLLLQVINRHEPLFAHALTQTIFHPEQLYRLLIQLIGELATLNDSGSRCVPLLPEYRHEGLGEVFLELISEVRKALSSVSEGSIVALKLLEEQPNRWLVRMDDMTAWEKPFFVLGVYAQMPAEELRQLFPAQIKIAPVEILGDLVNRSLPGIEVKPLAVAPRQIPYHGNCTYFALNTQNKLWKNLPKSAGLAFHIGGSFPELRLALWALKESRYG